MTAELTHDQAIALRNVATPAWGYVVESIRELDGLWMSRLIIDAQTWGRMLTDDGRKALAAYDAKWVILLRSDVAKLVEGYGAVEFSAQFRIRAALEAK